ncbi:hypothetical protein BT96DRAFT_912997 [Gymnopus androsaceus JB14]|uniref:Uncharacterized protein n=1 Tax=Gymnopus androsaceus JB14 TaxID=1447944 RepID=A0A6A4IPC0_9AGAR|nr:hypothetical protein BT96DRAFT_912997 [Gymnopus androsaceus JB14]
MDDDEEDKPSFRTVVMDQIAVLRKQLDKPEEAKPSTSIEETVASPVNVPLSPTSRPLPQPWRSSEQHIRFRPALRNDPSKYFTSRNTLDALKVRRAYANAANAANALRVPGGFGEDDPFSQVPPLPGSANDFLANNTLPGISGYWTSN